MNPKITGIILLVVGLGVGLYFINSGAAKKLGEIAKLPGSTSTVFITQTSSISQVQTSSNQTGPASSSASFSWAGFFTSLFGPHNVATLPTVSGGTNGGGQVSSNGSMGSNRSNGSSNSGDVTLPNGFTASQLSPYYHNVRLSGVSSGEINLTTYPAFAAPTSTVDITGWEIKTNRSGEFIPQAVNIYNPASANSGSDIILTLAQYQPEYVNIYSNSAPLNLHVNECMGYLNTPQQFNPGFSYSCPPIDRSQLSQFSGACQNYIVSLGNCQQPDFGSYYFPRNDYQCENYLQGKYNYNWCVSTYASSPSFLGNEWRIWMGSSPLDPYHDNVELVDRNGLLVDIYTY